MNLIVIWNCTGLNYLVIRFHTPAYHMTTSHVACLVTSSIRHHVIFHRLNLGTFIRIYTSGVNTGENTSSFENGMRSVHK